MFVAKGNLPSLRGVKCNALQKLQTQSQGFVLSSHSQPQIWGTINYSKITPDNNTVVIIMVFYSKLKKK